MLYARPLVCICCCTSFVISWHCCLFLDNKTYTTLGHNAQMHGVFFSSCRSCISWMSAEQKKCAYVYLCVQSIQIYKINTTNRRKLNEKNYVPYCQAFFLLLLQFAHSLSVSLSIPLHCSMCVCLSHTAFFDFFRLIWVFFFKCLL